MSDSFSFIHAADLHLGTPFSGLGETSPRMAHLLRDATLSAYENLIDLCIEEAVDFLIIAGDVYDGPQRSIRVLDRFLKGASRLNQKGIRMFVATGNHDPLDARAWASLGEPPPNLLLFPAKPSSHEVTREGRILAVVHGVGYHGKTVREDLASTISRKKPDGFEIGVLHASLGTLTGNETYAPTTLATLKATGLDYWALGHVHTRTVANQFSPVICYPGNTQALSARETGERGAYLVRVDNPGTVKMEFRALDSVRFANCDIDLTGVTASEAIPRMLLAAAREAGVGAKGRALLLNLALTGKTELYEDLSRPGELEELMHQLREELADFEPPLWVNRLLERTSAPFDLAALAKSQTIEGELVTAAASLLDDPDSLCELCALTFARLQEKPDMRRLLGEAFAGVSPTAELLGARDLALGLLLGEEN